jgi:hypothetical protein
LGQSRNLAILVLVLLAHAAVFWWIAHRIPRIGVRSPLADDSHALEIALERALEAPGVPRGSQPRIPAGPSPTRRSSTQPAPAEAAAPTPPATQPKPDAGHDEDARRALRQVLACNAPDAFGLTRDQRADCFHGKPPAAPLPQPFDPREIAAFEADARREPLLTRTPKNGCEPRVADRASPLANHAGGRSSATTTGGVGCAWSY